MVLTVALALLLASCNSEADREKQEQSKREARHTKLVNDLAAKYNASVDWGEKLKERKPASGPYTIDVEEALIRSDKKPILFEDFEVEDVARENNNYVVRVNYYGNAHIYFVLECTPELASKLLSRGQGFDQVVVVASISSVKRPSIKLESESPTSEDPPDIDVSTSHMFIAKGVALDLEFLE